MTRVNSRVVKPSSTYSLTRYLFSAIWIFTAFSIAQLADGYQFDFIYSFSFCALMSLVAGRIKSAFALGAYVGFSILLAHFVIATYSINYSSEQFFPSFWGPLDLVLVGMMWASPLLVLIADGFDQRISRVLAARIIKALVILKSKFVLNAASNNSVLVVFVNKWLDQCQLGVNTSRAPPLFV
jgi:hypothetical protein